jgi:hypothetical protein
VAEEEEEEEEEEEDEEEGVTLATSAHHRESFLSETFEFSQEVFKKKNTRKHTIILLVNA